MSQNILKNITVLYVEDEKDIRDEMVEFLSSKVKKLYLAENGKEGLEAYKKYSPNIVITDVTMPLMNGVSMAKEIKNINKEAVVILNTALGDAKTLTEAINIGIDGYILKPIELPKLTQILEKHSQTIEYKSKLKREEKLLKEYKEAVDITAHVTKTDTNGVITFANDRFCELMGYSKEELIGKNHSIVRHPDTQKSVFKNLWETIKAKKVYKGLVKNKKKNGEECYLATTIVPIKDENDEVIEYLAIRFDITKEEQYRKILQKQLDSSTGTLNEKIHRISTYENAIAQSNYFSRTDSHGRIVYVNDFFCERTGYEKNELIGKPHSIIRHPDVPKEFFKEMWDTIKAKKTWKGIIKNIDKKGETFFMDTTIVPVLDTNNEIVEYMSIRHDVTELISMNIEIEETQREIISTMGAIGETRSKETGNHVKRVAEYSKLLAVAYGMDTNEAEMIKMASPMHDIGKIGISDDILNKPAKLTAQEFELMKKHSILGYEMLKSSQRPILRAASIIALEHHEKWDGSGYPNAKKGEEIHIYGRITAIADVFDALGSDRIYKKAWQLEAILDFFKKERGVHFDPKMVDIFFENLNKILEIRDAFRD